MYEEGEAIVEEFSDDTKHFFIIEEASSTPSNSTKHFFLLRSNSNFNSNTNSII